MPSYTWFRRCRIRGTNTWLQWVWAGVHLISLHPPWITTQGFWRSWAALPGKSCCSCHAQAAPSSSASRAGLAFPVPDPSALRSGASCHLQLWAIWLLFSFFKSGKNCPHLNGVADQSHLLSSGMDHPRGEDGPCLSSVRMGMWAGSELLVQGTWNHKIVEQFGCEEGP